MFRRKGFTLMEIIVALIIIGILAAVAVPSYLTFTQQGAAKAAQNNLISIYNAQKNFYFSTVGNGNYCSTGSCPGASCCDTEADINTNLNLNITDNNFSYACTTAAGPPQTFTCQAIAVSIPGPLTLTVTGSQSGNAIVMLGGTGCATTSGAQCNPTCSPAASTDCPN